MERYGYLRNLHDKMADGKTAHQKIIGVTFDGRLIPCRAKVSCKTISNKDESRLHRQGKKMLPGIFMGYVKRAGGRMVR